MWRRRLLTSLTTLTRRATTLVSQTQFKPKPLIPTPKSIITLTLLRTHIPHTRHFSSTTDNENEDEDEEEEEEFEEDYEELEDKGPEAEAEYIGYKVVGPLERSERVFKPYEPVFAVVQVGSHQFKVCNGDTVYVERLKYCDVNDKLILNKVLLVGSSTQTIVGRPILPDAAVHAVVEEHALDEKVIIFKKKRRKNYRRTRGHRQELTRLRITDIHGIEKPEITVPEKPSKAVSKKPEKVAVAA